MALLTKEFRWTEWEATGEMGWELKGCGDAYDPSNYAPGLAHDVLEHFELGTVADEIEAIAVMYWLRYGTGYYPASEPYGRPMTLDDIGSEFINHYRALETVYACPTPEPEIEEIEEDLAEIISAGRKALREEFSTDIEEGFYEEEIAESILENYADWFRRGYRRGIEKYGKIGRNRLTGIFQDLTELFSSSIQKHEFFGEEELSVTLDLETGELTFSILKHCGECMAMVDVDEWLCEDCTEANEEE
jgi:hypothetical protein